MTKINKLFSNTRYADTIKQLLHPLRKFPLTLEQSGEAARRWDFPSDHLPVYGRVNNCQMGSANILNNSYISHIQNIPSWSESSLVTESKIPSTTYPGMSLREEKMVRHLYKILVEERKLDILGLQECSDRMCHLLKKIFEPLNIGVIVGDGKWNNHATTLVNLDTYVIRDTKITPIFHRDIPKFKGLVWDEWRPAVDVRVEAKKRCIGFPEEHRVLNVHISSTNQNNFYKLARLYEVRSYLDAFPTKRSPLTVLGDFNANENLIEKVFNGDYISLRTYHTQIECVPANKPHLVSIDDIRTRPPKNAHQMIELRPLPLQDIDPLAHKNFEEIFKPLINTQVQRRQILSETQVERPAL